MEEKIKKSNASEENEMKKKKAVQVAKYFLSLRRTQTNWFLVFLYAK